jgi:nucleotide-binding universal stress UspA family protein
LRDAGVDTVVHLVEGPVAESLLSVAAEVDATLIAVGHHPHPRLGPQLVGHVTAELLRRSDRPIAVVPQGWDPDRHRAGSVVVGVGVARGTRAAIRWAVDHASTGTAELRLVHALGPRSLFRPDGVLDVLAFHLDPSVVPTWVEEDLTALAEQVRDQSGGRMDIDVSVAVEPGRTGPVLVEAGAGAQLLVIGRGEPPFLRRHAIAPYLRHALVNAPCPVVVVPAPPEL